MEAFLWFVGILFAGLIFFTLRPQSDTERSRALAQKFAGLGTIAGKTKHEIIAVVGPPTSFSALAGNQTLLQWQATGYHIALSFTDDVCNGVTHEYTSQL